MSAVAKAKQPVRSAGRSRKPPPPPRPAHRAAGMRPDLAERLPFEQAAAVVLGELQHALIGLFAAAPGGIRKAADVERAFGVNHLLGWQVYRIASAQNPLAAGMHVPARVSMKKLLTAAARRRVSVEVIERIAEAFEAFERLVESDAGDRDELGAMLNAFLPEERRKQELASKQFVFKGMSQLKGLTAEIDAVAMFFNLSPTGDAVDRVSLNCEFGLRRVRPNARIVLGSGDTGRLEKPILTLDGQRPSNPLGALLPQFSSSPLPNFELIESGGMIDYCVAGQEVGMRSAVDIVIAERREGALPRYLMPDMPRFGGPAYTTTTPVKRMTLDAFVHEDVFPGVAPQLWVYDTAARGTVQPIDDPKRQHDRLDISEGIRALPTGLAGAGLPHVPRYLELLEYVYGTVGWDAARFRGYRLDVEYPMYGAEYLMGFRLADPPAAR